MEPSRDERACFKGGSENILFCLKGHRKSQLGSLAEPARSRPNGLSCLAGRFYGLQSRISNKIYSEPLKHALSPCEGRIKSFSQFYLKSTQRTVCLCWILLGCLNMSVFNNYHVWSLLLTSYYVLAGFKFNDWPQMSLLANGIDSHDWLWLSLTGYDCLYWPMLF